MRSREHVAFWVTTAHRVECGIAVSHQSVSKLAGVRCKSVTLAKFEVHGGEFRGSSAWRSPGYKQVGCRHLALHRFHLLPSHSSSRYSFGLNVVSQRSPPSPHPPEVFKLYDKDLKLGLSRNFTSTTQFQYRLAKYDRMPKPQTGDTQRRTVSTTWEIWMYCALMFFTPFTLTPSRVSDNHRLSCASRSLPPTPLYVGSPAIHRLSSSLARTHTG